MKTGKNTTIHTLARLLAPLCLVACVAALVTMSFPYDSLGGSGLGKIEMKKDTTLEMTEIPLNVKLVVLRGRVVKIRTAVQDNVCFSEVLMLLDNQEAIGSVDAMLIVPVAGVQRIFELGMEREISVEALGYKISPPEGTVYKSMDFYKIAEATIVDPTLLLTSEVVQ